VDFHKYSTAWFLRARIIFAVSIRLANGHRDSEDFLQRASLDPTEYPLRIPY
jgi:hypothetical protein